MLVIVFGIGIYGKPLWPTIRIVFEETFQIISYENLSIWSFEFDLSEAAHQKRVTHPAELFLFLKWFLLEIPAN